MLKDTFKDINTDDVKTIGQIGFIGGGVGLVQVGYLLASVIWGFLNIALWVKILLTVLTLFLALSLYSAYFLCGKELLKRKAQSFICLK